MRFIINQFPPTVPPTLSGPVSITSHGIGEKMVPSVFPGTPILQLNNEKKHILYDKMSTKPASGQNKVCWCLHYKPMHTYMYSVCKVPDCFMHIYICTLQNSKIGNGVWQVAEHKLNLQITGRVILQNPILAYCCTHRLTLGHLWNNKPHKTRKYDQNRYLLDMICDSVQVHVACYPKKVYCD